MPAGKPPLVQSRWLELQCPACGYLWYPDMVEPDGHCPNKACATHPLVRPYILNQFDLATAWLHSHARPAADPTPSVPKA